MVTLQIIYGNIGHTANLHRLDCKMLKTKRVGYVIGERVTGESQGAIYQAVKEEQQRTTTRRVVLCRCTKG